MAQAKQVPYEKNYKHWQELYEMEKNKCERVKEEAQNEIYMWQRHAVALTDVISKLLGK